MFDTRREVESRGVHRYIPACDGEPIAWRDLLRLWELDEAFRSFFIGLLAEAPFRACRWETPPITAATVDRDFEFVLIDAPELERSPDTRTFADRFKGEGLEEGIAVFDNLGGDATMLVPSPRGPDSVYPHLAAFVRSAPEFQQHALFRRLGEVASQRLSDRPLWINTAGTGVAWLHVRLDSRPKYYLYAPFKRL